MTGCKQTLQVAQMKITLSLNENHSIPSSVWFTIFSQLAVNMVQTI